MWDIGSSQAGCLGLLAAGALSACVEAPGLEISTADPPLGTIRQALLGVPEDGYPSYDELLGLVAMNRTRSDPNNPAANTADPCSGHRDPQPPLVHDHDASQAARFHCASSSVNDGGLSHDSYCELRTDIEATACDGSASCACESGTECWSCTTLGGCGTGYAGRMSRFGFTGSPVSECGAAGYGNSWDAVTAWVTENPCNSATVGHRNAVTSGSPNVAGTGSHYGPGCWPGFQFADFGSHNGLVTPRVATAIHRPESGGASTEFTFYASYYDLAGAPTAIDVVIDGVCHGMNVEIGEPGNTTFIHAGSVGAEGCHEYWVLATDADGERFTYPETGSYQISVGSGACGDELYTADRLAADCEDLPCLDDEICGNGVDDDCNDQIDDGCGSGGSGPGGSSTGGSGTGGDPTCPGGPCDPDLAGDNEALSGACACRTVGQRGTEPAGLLWLALALGLPAARRFGRRSGARLSV